MFIAAMSMPGIEDAGLAAAPDIDIAVTSQSN
jgi:hypothetical protein